MDWFSINEALNVLKALGFLVLEMVVYAFLIFNYYRFLSRKNIFNFNIDRYKDTGDRVITGFLNFFLALILYPIVLFVWFAVLAVILGFLGKNQSGESILFISMALISTVRVAAYYNEDLSKDLAKMLPFTLLGIFIVDQSYFNFQISLTLIEEIPKNWQNLIYYFAFIFGLELVLRIIYIIIKVSIGQPKDVPEKTNPKDS